MVENKSVVLYNDIQLGAHSNVHCLLNNSQWLSSHKTVAQSITFLLPLLILSDSKSVPSRVQTPTYAKRLPDIIVLQCQHVEVASISQNAAQSTIFMLHLNPMSS